jgi:hypothetical protein
LPQSTIEIDEQYTGPVRSRVVKKRVKYPGGDVLYTGEVDKSGKPHGFGEWVFAGGDAEGSAFMGMFQHGSFRGIGMTIFKVGQKQIGQLVDGTVNGVALIEYPSGNRYYGQAKDGRRHGFGLYVFTDGDMYLGGFVEEQYHGPGLFVNADGSKVAAEFEFNQKVLETKGKLHSLSYTGSHFLQIHMLFRNALLGFLVCEYSIVKVPCLSLS